VHIVYIFLGHIQGPDLGLVLETGSVDVPGVAANHTVVQEVAQGPEAGAAPDQGVHHGPNLVPARGPDQGPGVEVQRKKLLLNRLQNEPTLRFGVYLRLACSSHVSPEMQLLLKRLLSLSA